VELNQPHYEAIRAILCSCTLVDAARRCGVPVRTLSDWRKDPAFAAELASQRQGLRLANRCYHRLVQNAALEAAVRDCTHADPAVRQKAYIFLLELGLNRDDLEYRLDLLRQAPPPDGGNGHGPAALAQDADAAGDVPALGGPGPRALRGPDPGSAADAGPAANPEGPARAAAGGECAQRE